MGGVGLVPVVFFFCSGATACGWCGIGALNFLFLNRSHGWLVVWDWYLHFFSTFFVQEPQLVDCVGLVPSVCQEPGIARRVRRGGRHLRQKKKSVPQYNYSIEAIMEGTFEGGKKMDASLFTMYPEGWW